MTLARSQAESVVLWIGKSRPQSEVDLYETITTEHVWNRNSSMATHAPKATKHEIA